MNLSKNASSFSTLYHIESSYIVILLIFFLFVTTFWIPFLSKRLWKSWKEYKFCLVSANIDSHKYLYNCKTVFYKNVMLLLIVIIELLYQVLFISFFEIQKLRRISLELKSTFKICVKERTSIPWTIEITYYNIWTMFYLIIVVQLMLAFLQLFSFLSTYLTHRYYGHSLPKRIAYKHIAWWCTQCLILWLGVIYYLRIFIPLLVPTLLFTNWIILFRVSLKLYRAIRSVLYDIRYFECDEVRYKAGNASLSAYKIFITSHIIALFLFLTGLTVFFLYNTLDIFLTKPCYFEVVYNIPMQNFALSLETRLGISSSLLSFWNYFKIIIELLYVLALVAPSLLFLTAWAFQVLTRGSTKRKSIFRFNRAFIQPLLT